MLWEEPFGLVMIEALACGTPVIAFRRGSVPEIIKDGVNGFIVDNVDEMAGAVEKIKQISPANCGSSVIKRFSVERMVNEYEDLFKKIVSR
ncbi:MAG: glycosyltransferase [bacterium]|nr:glycosyltransferase [bacterium]